MICATYDNAPLNWRYMCINFVDEINQTFVAHHLHSFFYN